MPAIRLYFIALVPPATLQAEVKTLKEEMKNRFGAGHALKSPAHITLQMPFRRNVDDEPDLIQRLAKFAARQIAFPVQLSGFGCFAPKVIYVSVADHQPIQLLHDQLQYFLLDQLNFTKEAVSARFHPHLTVATRDLSENAFYDAWPEFETREFQATFEAKSIFLLKHNGAFWDIYREFALQYKI